MFDITQRQMKSKEVRQRPFICPLLSISCFIQDIPNLDLGRRAASPVAEEQPVSPTVSISTTGADVSGPSSRRTSVSSIGRPGSGTSSRSTSFNLPSEARNAIRADSRSPGEEVEFDEEMDEESMCTTILTESN